MDERELARIGAEITIERLQSQIDDLRRRFLGKGPKRATKAAATATATEPTARPVKQRKRRAMSAAEKAEVSKRMKKYWKARREAKA
jgi:hypothetical protein